MRRRFVRALAALLVIAIVAGAVGPLRRAALRSLGHLLVAADAVQPADVIAMDMESGAAGALEVRDLYRAQPNATVALLVPDDTSIDDELKRRGIVLPNVAFDVLYQLGVPKNVVIQIPAGEGGTTETTAALGAWARAHPEKRLLVVVGSSHGRRYRRTLRRAWPEGQPPAAVVTTPYSLFHADDWWRSRATVREGLVELEKLAMDCVQHPW